MSEIEIKDGYVIDLSQKLWWRPISTAPLDGTWVLVFVPETDVNIRIGRYFSNETFEFGKSIRKSEGWAVGMSSWDKHELEPSHWMPLPDAPV
jgi:hypothetical protein